METIDVPAIGDDDVLVNANSDCLQHDRILLVLTANRSRSRLVGFVERYAKPKHLPRWRNSILILIKDLHYHKGEFLAKVYTLPPTQPTILRLHKFPVSVNPR